MKHLIRIGLVAIVMIAVPHHPTPATVHGQVPCQDVFYDAIADWISTCNLGTPNAEGVTVPDQLGSVGERRAFEFRVGPRPQAGYIYLGDQWYDMEAALYTEDLGTEIGRWQFQVRSREQGARVLQFVRPDKITPDLEPDKSYLLLVYATSEANFDPSRGFTLRVALGAPVCGTAPADDPDPLYVLALAYEPKNPGPFDLMTFGAFVTPPYSDLFDFEWQIDGRQVPGPSQLTIQRAATDFRGGPHTIRVTAKGVRQYPDPDQPHIPPTLSVECTLQFAL